MAVTPTLRLTLGSDTQTNRNWEILDDALRRISKGQQIADDLNVLGSLTVRDNADVGGTLHVAGLSTLSGGTDTSTLTAADILTGTLDATGRLTGHAGLTLDGGSIVFPNQSLDGADFQKAATVQGVWVGTAAGQVSLSATAASLATVATDATEELGRWEIVVAQGTLQISYGSTPPAIVVTLELRRDATAVQSRVLEYYSSATLDGLDLDVPFTMVRLAQPPTAGGSWSVWGSASINAGALAMSKFAQMHCLQLR
jgi:hypothetical protein